MTRLCILTEGVWILGSLKLAKNRNNIHRNKQDLNLMTSEIYILLISLSQYVTKLEFQNNFCVIDSKKSLNKAFVAIFV